MVASKLQDSNDFLELAVQSLVARVLDYEDRFFSASFLEVSRQEAEMIASFLINERLLSYCQVFYFGEEGERLAQYLEFLRGRVSNG